MRKICAKDQDMKREWVAGCCVVLLLAQSPLLRLQLAVWAHGVVHAVPFFDVQRRGIVQASRERAVVAYGFSRPIRWTNETAHDPRWKRDALPVHVIELLLPQEGGWFAQRRVGTSLFIESDRNVRKRQYMSALTTQAIEQEYRLAMREELARPHDGATLQACALHVSARVTVRLHTGRRATRAEAQAAVHTMEVITRTLNGALVLSSLADAQAVLRGAVQEARGGLARRWKDAGMSDPDVYAEFAHNLFGMGLQWTYVLLQAWRNAPSVATTLDAAQFVVDHPPATVAASRAPDGALVLHDLERRCRHARRPHFARCPHAVQPHADQPCVSGDDPNFAPFGHELRRCPGEYLTYAWVQECATALMPRRPDVPRMLGIRVA